MPAHKAAGVLLWILLRQFVCCAIPDTFCLFLQSDQDSEWNKVDSLNLLAMIRKCCNWEAVSEGMKGRTAEVCASFPHFFSPLFFGFPPTNTRAPLGTIGRRSS
jgi:hypothetical protein